jgi:hypothetical protein
VYVGRPLSTISLADMITNAEVQARVKKAEAQIAAGEFTEGIASLKAAWQTLIADFTRRFPGVEVPRLIPSRSHPKKSEELEHFANWWKDMRPKLQILMLGVDPVRFAAFEGLGPNVHFYGDNLRYYRSLEDPVIHTAESVDYCLMFVVGTAVRFQEAGRVGQPHDYYRIEVVTPSLYYDVRKPMEENEGELPVGHIIVGAQVGGGPWRDGDSTAWFWEDIENEKTFMIRLAAARILEAIPRDQYDVVRRERYDERNRRRAERKGK